MKKRSFYIVLGFALMGVLTLGLLHGAAATLMDGDALIHMEDPPGEPGWVSVNWDDHISDNVSNKTIVTFGDEFYRNVYERPFDVEEMVYHPELDIAKAEVTNDGEYYYFTIRLNGSNNEVGGLTGYYGIEIDVDMDGTGDYLIWAQGDRNSEWNSDGVLFLYDRNNDVGGKQALYTELNRRPEDSFEKVLFDGDADASEELLWKRRDPDDVYAIEFALKKSAINRDGMFLWSAWANDDADGRYKMDYNDLMTLEKAGSPVMGEEDYPMKGLSLMDNTCRLPYGFEPSGSEPGVCYGVSATPVPVKNTGGGGPPAPTPTPCNCPGCVMLNGVCTVIN